MPAHPFMPMNERYLKKLLYASWGIEEREADDEHDRDENLKPFEVDKRIPPTEKENALSPTFE